MLKLVFTDTLYVLSTTRTVASFPKRQKRGAAAPLVQPYLSYVNRDRNDLVRSFAGFISTCCGVPVSTINPLSMKTT